MRFENVMTIAASVTLSFATAWLISTRHVPAISSARGATPAVDVLRAQSIEVVDRTGSVRMRLASSQSDDARQPRFEMFDSTGRAVVSLLVSTQGSGTLYFKSPDKEAKVSLGYLWGSDSLNARETDPLSAWGMRVRGSEGKQLNLGFDESGQRLVPDQGSH